MSRGSQDVNESSSMSFEVRIGITLSGTNFAMMWTYPVCSILGKVSLIPYGFNRLSF